ncbi:hypothetical protein [Actinacidiphila sp. ITFR-21]|uniref:hypothetical protein n=1 Tax=Actinacidiphila sp. ITFR-21 TaxID=3075199 RepID=UPI00288A4872|nr:hypothetical protein [Streptomyces sp. ITFR-21]WNI14546.1 hypothetical protein RLT57_02660 [Streptomyces sp. ITFR-21]
MIEVVFPVVGPGSWHGSGSGSQDGAPTGPGTGPVSGASSAGGVVVVRAVPATATAAAAERRPLCERPLVIGGVATVVVALSTALAWQIWP